MGAVALGAMLFALLLLIVAAMVWQEARKAPDTSATYVIEEVVPFAYRGLSEGAADRLDLDDITRILEWEVYYLQGLDRSGNGARPAPVAGSAEAVQFIIERCRVQGREYRAADVAEVLAQEAAYLVDIGAVGPAVEEST